MPQIAVVIPSYNRVQMLGRALDSVLGAEASSDLEVIVVDDASDDGTSELVGRFEDPRLRYDRLEKKTNGNVARNRGIALSTAPIIAFLDSDDAFEAGRIGRLVKFFQDHPDIDAVADAFEVRHRGRTFRANVPSAVLEGRDLERMLVCHLAPLTCSAIAVRRTALEKIGGFASELQRQQDRDLLLRLARDHRVALGTGADVIKHQSADSLSRRLTGYVEALDTLVARHPVFQSDEYRDVVAYLSLRMVAKALLSGRADIALSELRVLVRSAALPSVGSAIMRYRRGRHVRSLAKTTAQNVPSRAPSRLMREEAG